METIRGESEFGVKRDLEVSVDKNEKAYLWIHSPGSKKNGYSIYVDPWQLIEALAKEAISRNLLLNR